MTDDVPFSKEELLRRIGRAWDAANVYLRTLTPEQMTQPTDAAGWTPKDHIMHLVMWEAGVVALLKSQPRVERMGIDREMWNTHDYDKINDVLQKRDAAKPLDEVFRIFAETHQDLITTIEDMSDEELQLPYHHYEPGSDQDHPVYGTIVGNTNEHYPEHMTWIAAIIG